MSELIQNRFQPITANLGTEDILEIDRVAASLRALAWPYPNRSLVLREAVSCLTEALRGKSREEIFRFFISRTGRRAQGPAKRELSGERPRREAE